MVRVLRAIAGLPHDTVVLVEQRISIGRAADCDLQLGDPEVSRRHAKVEFEGAQPVLIDLSSAIGTYVNGIRVERHALLAGDEITIGRFRLRFDEVDARVDERRPPAKRGMEVLRQTVRFESTAHPAATTRPPAPPREPPPPPRPAPRASAPASAPTPNRPTGTQPMPGVPSTRPRTPATPSMLHRDDTARIVVPAVPRLPSAVMPRAPRSTMDLNRAVPDEVPPADPRAIPLRHGDSVPVTDGLPMDVDPLELRADAMTRVRAVFDYRYLRLQQLRHEILDHDELARLDELEHQLEHREGSSKSDAQRRYRRFGCAVPAWIAVFDGRRIGTASIGLEDISAGGAQLRATDLLSPGDACWLVVDLENEDPDPVVVFGARVVWATPADHRMGVVFSGNVHSGVDGIGLVRVEAGVG